jgi:hypothetical protein
MEQQSKTLDTPWFSPVDRYMEARSNSDPGSKPALLSGLSPFQTPIERRPLYGGEWSVIRGLPVRRGVPSSDGGGLETVGR